MPRTEVAAYYFPNYHQDARNAAWHGPGWTEWELVKAAKPRWEGHRQPIIPSWGCFDESDPAWAAKEIDLAADHGVTSFIYDWYWYEDGPYLQGALEDGFLRAPNRERMSFALMWANHDWTDIHPAGWRNRPATLAEGKVSRAAWERLTDHVVRTYLTQPNYLKLDGCPYFSIYQLKTFIDGLGGVQAAADAIGSFRDKVKRAGFRDLHLNLVVWGVMVLPTDTAVPGEQRMEIVKRLGCSSVTSYCWVHHASPVTGGTFPHGRYEAVRAVNEGVWAQYRREFPVPYHPNVSMGWDSTPRTLQSDSFGDRGYPFSAVMEGNTPEAFRDALASVQRFIAAGSDPHPMITINAWNEWTEGSYLLPDTVTGARYLEAIRDVFGAKRAAAH